MSGGGRRGGGKRFVTNKSSGVFVKGSHFLKNEARVKAISIIISLLCNLLSICFPE